MRSSYIAVGICACVSVTLGQMPAESPLAATTPLDPSAIMVPIHSHAPDPDLGAYGTWAVGPGYKVSFHDGFVFYPLLGRDYPQNRPLAWVTESSSVGHEVVMRRGETPVHRHSEWRYEYHYRGLVETYDVRRDGVEQTFTLSERPTSKGDWVVTGRIATSLTADPHDGHGALTFRDPSGNALIRYGRAVAIDARGDRIPVTTRFDGQRVQLTVDGSWLDRARLPVRLDPLTTAQVEQNSTDPYGEMEIGYDAERGSVLNIMYAYTVWYSSVDADVFCVLDGSAAAQVVFSDVTTTSISEHPSVAFVGGADRWVIAFQRSSAANTFSWVRLWVHDKNNPSPSAGSLVAVSHPGGATARYPDVGGTAADSSGVHALIVYQTDITNNNSNTPSTEVWGALLNAATKTMQAPVLLADTPVGTTYDRERPAVNQQSAGGNASWVTAWQDRNRRFFSRPWVIRTQRITATGIRAASATASASLSTANAIRPSIDGRDGRYMVAYLRASTTTASTGTVVEVARFDALEGSSQITGLRQNVISSTSSGSFADLAISHDFVSKSHWALAYQNTRSQFLQSSVVVARLGYTGGVVESAVATSRVPMINHHPALTFRPEPYLPSEFLLCYAEKPAALWFLTRQAFSYDATAGNFPYGTGCTGNILPAWSSPFAGSEFFATHFTVAPSVPVTLLVSAAPANVSLAPIGLPACSLLVDPNGWVPVPTTTNTSGVATVTFALADQPKLVGDVYFQWLVVTPGNPPTLGTSVGVRSQIR